MAYQPIARYQLKEGPPYSAYSQPRTDHPDGSYKIHLVKATRSGEFSNEEPVAKAETSEE